MNSGNLPLVSMYNGANTICNKNYSKQNILYRIKLCLDSVSILYIVASNSLKVLTRQTKLYFSRVRGFERLYVYEKRTYPTG